MAKIAVSLIVDEVDFYVQNLFTRFPFQYGMLSKVLLVLPVELGKSL